MSRSSYTIADGIAVKVPGKLTGAILEETLDEMVEVTDEEIQRNQRRSLNIRI